MWLLGIAVIVIVAAIITNFLVKWLNRKKKQPSVPEWDKQNKGVNDPNSGKD
ncbi:hypothetical protein [Arachidicoccus terrestris]|uniref:hypothetical protein n=1 Tax=Arachidicoccus terrestris TaxID=2875539 RepID=UPI001CC7CDB3|nr:hypothetical protein [Arachidicoccus terrestris]UAY57215.1 hypothetical protein K9M52_09610 [Arachidicoccus terrestris]